MQITRIHTMAAALVAACLAQPVIAAEEGYFVGFSAGVSGLQIDDFGNGDYDSTDTAYQVNVGYNFTRNWGVQAAYNRLGDFDDRDVNIEVDGLELNGMFSLDIIEAWSVHARLGVYFYDVEAKASGNSQGSELRGSGSEIDGVITLGSELVADENIRFNLEGKYLLDNDVDLYTVLAGMNIGFGGNNTQ